MPNINDRIKQLAEKLKQTGKAGAQDFAKGVSDAALESGQDLLKAGPDVAARYQRTVLDKVALASEEMLSGRHEPREWAQLDSQDESHNLQANAILKAQALRFVKNVVGILGGVLGGMGGQVGEAIAATIDGVLKDLG